MTLLEKLESRARPIRAGIAGAGEFGTEILSQSLRMTNFQVSAIADAHPGRAYQAFLDAGLAQDAVVRADSTREAESALRRGLRVAAENALLLPFLPLDVACDATGDPCFGAEFADACIREGRHFVEVNIEAESAVGAVLASRAASAGIVYTEADGDQPSLIAGLVDWARLLGLEIVAAGKWTKILADPRRRDEASRVQAGYEDGSKNQVEMCCTANCTGLPPDVRGLHLPSASIEEIPNLFRESRFGGILGRAGIVDAVNTLARDGVTVVEPRLGGGVFAVVRSDSVRYRTVIRKKGFITSEDGGHALIYRPFHFVGIEAPVSMVKAVLEGCPTAAPLRHPVADVIAVAKEDLPAGTLLDGIGGRTVRGEVAEYGEALRAGSLPLGLAEGVVLGEPVRKGDDLKYGMLRERGRNAIWELRALQDRDYVRLQGGEPGGLW